MTIDFNIHSHSRFFSIQLKEFRHIKDTGSNDNGAEIIFEVIISHVRAILESASVSDPNITFKTHEDCRVDGNHHGDLDRGQNIGQNEGVGA